MDLKKEKMGFPLFRFYGCFNTTSDRNFSYFRVKANYAGKVTVLPGTVFMYYKHDKSPAIIRKKMVHTICVKVGAILCGMQFIRLFGYLFYLNGEI